MVILSCLRQRPLRARVWSLNAVSSAQRAARLQRGSARPTRQEAVFQLLAGVSKRGTHRSSKTKSKSRPRDFQNRFRRAPVLPKSSPRPSKIEAWSLQNRARSSFGRLRTVGGQWGDGRNAEKYPKMRNLAPTWRPKRLQNRDPKPKKSTLKNSTF